MLQTPRAKRLSSAPLGEMMPRRTCSPRSFVQPIKTFTFYNRTCREELQLTAVESRVLVLEAGNMKAARPTTDQNESRAQRMNARYGRRSMNRSFWLQAIS